MDTALWLYKHKKINEEQIRQMNIHKWLESEKSGRDLGEDAVLDWIEKHARNFREWAEKVPYMCARCGICGSPKDEKTCVMPFDEERMIYIEKKIKGVV